jgi:3-oxoacyl-[acyl-carrier protein] reductase
MTETELIADVPQKTRLMVEAKAPRGRLAKPRDIANAIFYLADSQSDYVTGETLRINGGMVMV